MTIDQLYMAVFFCYLVKRDLSSVKATYTYTNVTFTKYQNNTAMFIWSGCSNILTTGNFQKTSMSMR